MAEPSAKRFCTSERCHTIGKCRITSRFRTTKFGTPVKGLLSGSSYIIGLDSVPKNIRKGFEVVFFINGDVRNDLIFARPFVRSFASKYFFFNEQYYLNASPGSKVRCLVHCNNELWMSEESTLQTPHNKRKKTFRDYPDSKCLDKKSSLSSMEKVQELLHKLGYNDFTTITRNGTSIAPVTSTSGSDIVDVTYPPLHCDRVYSKYFIGNFIDTDQKGMSRIAAYYFEKFAKLLERVLNMRIDLSSEQIQRLEQLGYVQNAKNPSLYTFSYVMGCTCATCLNPQTEFLNGSCMASFAFPTLGEEDPLYNDLETMWSYYDVFRHPFLNYGALITIMPSISDPKFGYTIFSLSYAVKIGRDFKLHHNVVLSTLIGYIEKTLRFVISCYPQEITEETRLAWIQENPYDILFT